MIIYKLKYGGVASQANLMYYEFIKMKNIVVLYSIINSQNQSKFFILNLIKSMIELKRFIASNNFDVIQIYGAFYAGILGLFLKKLNKIPTIIRVGSLIEDFYSGRILEKLKINHSNRKLSISYILRKILLYFTIHFLNQFDAVIFNSYFLKYHYEKQMKKPFTVIWNGIDTNVFTKRKMKRKTENSFKMLFVGRIAYRKGVHDIIKAANILRQNGFQVEIDLVGGIDGEDKYLEYLNKLICEFDMTKRVNFVGPIAHEKTIDFYQKNSVLILATNDKIYSGAEGLPNAIMEAMSCGLPIIATRIGGIPELVENYVNGFLVEQNDYKKIAFYCKKILQNNDLHEKIVESNYKKINNSFSITECTSKYISFYQFIINERR
ncbi:D-inositol-3-phosphate glycosyltransferase [subsurface metagenome]